MNSAGASAHHFAPVAVGVVLVAEAHFGVAATHQPVVGDRHAVGVAAEVVEHLCGAGEGALGVDHPGFLVERIEETALGGGIGERRARCGEFERARVKQSLEAGEKLAAKHRRERGHRKEKPAARSDPVPIGGECAGGDKGSAGADAGRASGPRCAAPAWRRWPRRASADSRRTRSRCPRRLWNSKP